jgi:hypothetical protein
MKRTVIAFMMIFICNIIYAQDFSTEIIINGNISYLDILLEVDQINDFTLNELRILRNTIFAKYGYKFNSDDLTNHFSQFSWYEGSKSNVENDLSSVDWQNIRLIQILENYYPTKIDYIFNFNQNGVYKLDSNFIITPIHTRDASIYGNTAASFYDYVQLEDFLFFNATQSNANVLFYDYLTNYCFDMGNWFEDVISIYYQSKNTLVVNGSGIVVDTGNRWYRGPLSVTVNFPNERFEDEIIGKTVYIPEQRHRTEFIYQGSTLLGGWYNQEPIHLISAFDKNIITILENAYTYEGMWGFDPERRDINVIYNSIYNVYFILVINYGFLSR